MEQDIKAIKLKDGRNLSYDEYGIPDGKPVIVFHGTPGSRFEGRLVHDAGVHQKVRCIAFDRPGIGLSDFKPHFNITDCQDDAIQLADYLNIDTFAVLGLSGGAPYAIAGALKNPERISKVALVSGVSPYNIPGATEGMVQSDRISAILARRAPIILRIFLSMMASSARKNPESFIASMMKDLPEPDKVVLSQRDISQWLVDTFLESVRSGTKGASRDYSLITREWGFQLKDISQPVYLWHGESDNMTPLSMGKYMADNIPNCQSKFITNESHISLIVNQADEILNQLTV